MLYFIDYIINYMLYIIYEEAFAANGSPKVCAAENHTSENRKLRLAQWTHLRGFDFSPLAAYVRCSVEVLGVGGPSTQPLFVYLK